LTTFSDPNFSYFTYRFFNLLGFSPNFFYSVRYYNSTIASDILQANMISDQRPQLNMQCDVLVVGGGAAGLAAAHTAAKQGLKVILLERYGFCGGGAVAGLSGTICGMYLATERTSSAPQQVVHGFLDQFVNRMNARNGLTPAVPYGKTYTHVHDPVIWREVADSFLREQNVQVIFHATVTASILEGERVAGVTAYTKEGPARILAKITIDSSGDADVLAMSGLSTTMGDNGRVQNPTMIFRLGGVDTSLFEATYGRDTIMPANVSALIEQANSSGRYKLPRQKIWLFTTTRPGELLCNCTRIVGPEGRELNAVIAADFTDAEIEGRLQVQEYARFFKEFLVGCGESYVNDTAVQVGVRQTRQGAGRVTLLNTDVTSGKKSADGIAISPWPIELHAGTKPVVNWLLDDYYEVPYGCFVPEKGLDLLFAGRCLSAQHEAVASARVTAQCFSYGHAIGHAAALAIHENLHPHQIEGRELRAILNQDGARMDI
jgi:hypothetical protein